MAAAATARVRVSIFLLAIVLLLATFYPSSHGVGDREEMISSGWGRDLLVLQKNTQIPNCSDMASQSQCLQNSKCRCCRSDSIDDMCFSSSEAWRLPQQVFSCN